MIETERVIDKLKNFSIESIFDADKRKRYENFLYLLCQVWVGMGKEKDSIWNSQVQRFGQFIDDAINNYDSYTNIEEFKNENNNY